jgi:hypothetical protein
MKVPTHDSPNCDCGGKSTAKHMIKRHDLLAEANTRDYQCLTSTNEMAARNRTPWQVPAVQGKHEHVLEGKDGFTKSSNARIIQKANNSWSPREAAAGEGGLL